MKKNLERITYHVELVLLLVLPVAGFSQVHWKNVDSLFQPLPASVHVYYTNDSIDGRPNIAYYASASLKSRDVYFTADTTRERRLTPNEYYVREHQPLLVVNCSFFEYAHNHNLNLVMKDGNILSYNNHSIPLKGKDTLKYSHSFGSALGIDQKRNADVAWLYTDSLRKVPVAYEQPVNAFKDSFNYTSSSNASLPGAHDWKMETAVGGGPVLLQKGEIRITNEEELRFAGKAINDKHPRTAMGYTKDGRLIIMVIEGRYPNKAEGVTLGQEAKLLKEVGCFEALNLDGGGSSCMLINGKQTITPSEKGEQRPVPSVFMVKITP